jgi:hypothetical protein
VRKWKFESYPMNRELSQLVQEWKAHGSIPQEGFDWSKVRENWLKTFPLHGEIIATLPTVLNRDQLRTVFASTEYSVIEKFLVVMIWGFGDRGYGPFRVTQMLKQSHTSMVLNETLELSRLGQPKDAYEFLSLNRIRTLGPAYSTKFLSFCTPREIGAPIYDSFVSRWIKSFALKDFLGVSVSSSTWNVQTYTKYWDWIKEHSDLFDCYPDEIELAIFRDASRKFSKRSHWSDN